MLAFHLRVVRFSLRIISYVNIKITFLTKCKYSYVNTFLALIQFNSSLKYVGMMSTSHSSFKMSRHLASLKMYVQKPARSCQTILLLFFSDADRI